MNATADIIDVTEAIIDVVATDITGSAMIATVTIKTTIAINAGLCYF